MKILLNYICLPFFILIGQLAFAQHPHTFDVKKAYKDAETKGIAPKFIDEYVKQQEALFNREHHNHNHATEVLDLGTIYRSYNDQAANNAGRPSIPQNIYCPNAGFEQFSFANWTGATGSVSDGPFGAPFPIYNQTGTAIVNPAGNNVSMININNNHTILTTPAINNVYPNCVGYDSIACRVIAGQTISEIPFVNPNGGPASVRINRINGFNSAIATKLTYNMALNPNNKNFTISYALVLQNGTHPNNQQPYFSVVVRDQNGNLVPGCSTYTVTCNANLTNTASPLFDPAWANSSIQTDVMYRKWSTYAFDFSNFPAITSVSVEFFVNGCTLGGHFGYAYVDAQCGQGGAVTSFCAGSGSAILSAPAGFLTYQWRGPAGLVSPAFGGTSASATITPVLAGQVFTCNVTSTGGCSAAFQTTIAITNVTITSVGSVPSCPNGASGSANVLATGSSTGYNYIWRNSLGAVVSNSQTATGLPPGTYSITASSPGCGMNTTTVTVGNAPPFFYSLAAPYCGTIAWIRNTSPGTNFLWYNMSGILIAGANSNSLTITAPVNGRIFFLGFTTASGCRDSIRYTLSQIPGGSIFVSNVKSICAGNTNATAVINLQTTAAPAIYSYTVTGPSAYNSVMSNTSATTFSVSNLAIASYTANVFDGQCLYNSTFTVSPYLFSYTLSPTASTICAGASSTLAVNFGNSTPSACGLTATGGCPSPNNIQVGTGTLVNSSTSFPAIYSNWWRNARHQILYRASELLAAGIVPGKLSSIAFNVTTINGTTNYPNFTIKMKCTSVTDLATSTFDNTGFTQVFFSPTAAISAGWNTYNLPTAYDWDGTTNILIDICSGDIAIPFTNNASSPYTTTPFTSVRYYFSDAIAACNQTSSSATSANRPNIRFGNCGGSNPSLFSYTWTPTANLAPTNSFTTIVNPPATTVYSIQVEPIGLTNCVQVQTSTVTVLIPTMPTITVIPNMCNNAPVFTMSVTPTGGAFVASLFNSTSGLFDPSVAPIGTNTVSYNLGVIGCMATATTVVRIEQFVSSALTSSINPFCITDPNLNLTTVSLNSNGLWTGPGVVGTDFNPSIAGAGNFVLNYLTTSFPTATLCPSTTTINVLVSASIQPTVSLAGPFCTSFALQTMTASPAGGVWTAPNSTGISPITNTGAFNPSSATIGNNTLMYTFTNGGCVRTATINAAVEQFITSSFASLMPIQCITDLSSSLLPYPNSGGGVWSGTAVTGNIFGPSTAGLGTFTLTYSTNSLPTASLCPSSSTMVVIVGTAVQPTITLVGPYCDNFANQNMTANPAGGVWTTTTVGTAISPSGIFTPSASIVGDNAIVYTYSNGGCVKSDALTISVVNFVPANLSGSLGPYCFNDPSVNLQPLAQNLGGTWNGTGVLGSVFSPNIASGTFIITYKTDPLPLGLCPDTKSISILVNPTPTVSIVSDKTEGCNYPLYVNYYTTTVNSGNLVWDFGDNSPKVSGLNVQHIYRVPGVYTASISYTNAAGCKDAKQAPFAVTVYSVPVASFVPDFETVTLIQPEVIFTNNSTILTGNSYNWTINNVIASSQTNISYTFTTVGKYPVSLIAIDNSNNLACQDTMTKIITVDPEVVIYVPNAFTPGNSDGLNDQLNIVIPPTGVDYSTFSITIFDRWGTIVFKSNDITKSWNGAKNNSGGLMKSDTYVYKISFSDVNKRDYEKMGHVILLIK